MTVCAFKKRCSYPLGGDDVEMNATRLVGAVLKFGLTVLQTEMCILPGLSTGT
jgi:hypothetical protein